MVREAMTAYGFSTKEFLPMGTRLPRFFFMTHSIQAFHWFRSLDLRPLIAAPAYPHELVDGLHKKTR